MPAVPSEVAADARGAAIRARGILAGDIGAGGADNQVSCTLIRVAEDEGRLVAVCRVNATGARLRAEVTKGALNGISTGDGIALSIPPRAICPLK